MHNTFVSIYDIKHKMKQIKTRSYLCVIT